MKKGIDDSHINGVIDWEKVKPQIDFAMLRAGYGNNHVDEGLHSNASSCEELGIPLGLYWFSYAYTPEMAKQEALDCLKQARNYHINYPIAFDFEYDSIRYAKENGITVTKDLVMELAKAFCIEIKNLGYHAAVYTNKDFSDQYFDFNVLEEQGYVIWYAHYGEHAGKDNIALWQYSSDGHIDGISTRVDMDYALKDFSQPAYGWQRQDGKWWYKRQDGSYPTAAWEQIDNLWYHFDSQGYMQTGWIQENNKWYYLKSSGAMASNEMLTIESTEYGEEKYVFAQEGHMMCTNDRGALI